MIFAEMKTGTRYVITKESEDGTFQIGNHVSLNDDGSINCQEARGWIDAEYAHDVTKGMEFEQGATNDK